MMAMRNASFGGRSTHGSIGPGGLGTFGNRRARRAERQAIVNNLAIAAAFVFVTAVIFGLL